jgi:hypothetical protein
VQTPLPHLDAWKMKCPHEEVDCKPGVINPDVFASRRSISQENSFYPSGGELILAVCLQICFAMLETFIWFSIPLLTCAFSLPSTSMFSSGLVSRHGISIPALPERLVVGYANWNECTSL